MECHNFLLNDKQFKLERRISMKACIISDSEFQTEEYMKLKVAIHSYLAKKDFEVKEIKVGEKVITYCTGCFGCWVKKPGECVICDSIDDINRECNHSDAVIYLSPIVFGQFSANIKNILDRRLPNVLPFKKKKKMVVSTFRSFFLKKKL